MEGLPNICENTYRFQEKINTSEYYRTLNLPKRFECPYMFRGYGMQKENVPNHFYRTTTSAYGWYTPTPHTVPHRFFPKANEFTTHLAKCGMYRNYSLNTAMDKTFY